MRDRTTIPDDWNGQDYEILIACIPKSQKWKAVLLGQFTELQRGRNWNGETGSILGAMAIGQEIRESVMACDLDVLVSHVDRIATALESVDNKTPQLYTISEMLEALQLGGLNFQEVEAILNILDVLPGLDVKIDPLKHLLDWIFKSQVLNNMYAQSTSQAVIAGAVGVGEVVDTVDTVYDDIVEGGLGTIINAINATGNFGSFITDVLDLFGTTTPIEEPRESTRVFNDVFVQGDSLRVNNYVNVDACCGEGAGSTEQTEGTEGGSPPVGASEPDVTINNRKCKASQYVVDSIMSGLLRLDSNPPPTWYELGQVEGYLRDVFGDSLVGRALDSVFGSWATVAEFVFGSSPDYGAIYTAMQNNYEDVCCAMFNATTSSDARTDVLSVLALPTVEANFLESLMVNNIMNLLFFAVGDSETIINGWPTTVDCTTGCDTCPDFYVAAGSLVSSAMGEVTVASSYSPTNGWHWARVAFNTTNMYNPAAACDPEVTVTDMATDVSIYDPAQNRPYQAQDTNNNFRYQNGPLVGGNVTQVRYVTFLNRDNGANPGPFEGTVKWS